MIWWSRMRMPQARFRSGLRMVRDLAGDRVLDGDGGLRVPDVAGGVEPGLGGGHSLEEIGPPGALVGLAHGVEGGAPAAHVVGHLAAQHLGRERALDEDVPLLVPGGAMELGGFDVERGVRSGFDRGGDGVGRRRLVFSNGIVAAAAGSGGENRGAEAEQGDESLSWEESLHVGLLA
jgi:hypothetical protein